MPEAQKVLVTGRATNGLAAYFKKLDTMQAKHAFSVVLALDLFSGVADDSLELAQLMAGQIAVPKVQVYVSVGAGQLPNKVQQKVDDGEEICENVTVLGKTSLLTLASGLRIGTFGGSYDPSLFAADGSDVEVAHDSSKISPDDVSTFRSLLTPPPTTGSLPPKPIPTPDVLLTHASPASIALLSSKPYSPNSTVVAPELDEVVRLAKPKYHFVGGAGVFWEREPFMYSNADGGGACRAISLGEMGNPSKERWFYAFSITPGAAAGPRPPNATASPYNPQLQGAGGQPRGMKRPAGALDATEDVNEYGVPNFIFGGQNGGDKGRKKGRGGPPDHYTCNICQQKGHWIQDCPDRAARDAERDASRASRKPISPDECWFCLSNPKVTKHLIASIGSETYLTLPKGQLCPTSSKQDLPSGSGAATSSSSVPGGGHVLIIPIAHYPTLLSIPSDMADPIISEVDAYKAALKKCYAEYGAELLAFEVGRLGAKGGHAHVQVCPIPKALATRAEEHFKAEGAKVGLAFEEDPSANAQLVKEAAEADGQLGAGYFRVDLPDGKVLVHRMQQGGRFDLGFGRATVASLLNTPERGDWRACVRSDAEEKGDTLRFKAAFKKYDPSD